MNPLKNKTCFISGATGGIGREIAKEMARHGCNLFLTSTSDDKLDDLSKDIRFEFKVDVFWHASDLDGSMGIDYVISETMDRYSSVDILINCAGIFPVKSLSETLAKDYETCFNINVKTPFLFCKEFSKSMQEKKWGRIVNIGSSSAYGGSKNTSIYCASKHALLGFSRALHEELKEDGIRVFYISPSGTKTPMGKLIPDENYNTFLNPKEVAKYVSFVISFDKELISNEIQLKRINT